MRRWLLVSALAVVLIAGCVVVTTGVDRYRHRWQTTYTVDLPDKWTIGQHAVQASSSTASLDGPAESLGDSHLDFGYVTCDLTIDALGESMAVPRGTTPVRVGDRAARYRPQTDTDDAGPYGLFWRGPNRAWAHLACAHLSLERTLLLAERIGFTSTPVSVPVRLVRVPRGYRPGSVVFRDPAEAPRLLLDADDPWRLPLAVWVNTAGDRPAQPGEHVDIGGRSARLWSADRMLCFEGAPATCVSEDAIDHIGEDDAWPAGERDAVIDVATHLVQASDLADRNTWFEGRDAFPN